MPKGSPHFARILTTDEENRISSKHGNQPEGARVLKQLVSLGLLGAAAITATHAQAAPVGIPRSLAQDRASRVGNVRYNLSYTLVPHAPSTEATEHLRFTLKTAGSPLLLDFRDGALHSLTINGAAINSPEQSNGHITLPAKNLHAGENTVDLAFSANIGASEKAITRFEDKDDGSEYLYTLFVPMDADMAFPCFDQPDLKARFTLAVNAPDAWSVITNTASTGTAQGYNGVTLTTFAQTEPISTYLFAFAAGPFVKVNEQPGLPGLYVRKSKLAQAQTEAPSVQKTAADGITYLSKYFAQPFPFPKYDMVLLPGFAYGGMEHAGATFLKEESVLFRTAPTETNRINRQILVLHELTHQWFGDFTTMRWFDDLWLKEGFAQYMAYKALATLRPDDDIDRRFYQAIKPLAYGIDETEGTTPIYQDIPNLKDAKSAYGAIVYQKAPAVMKQLEFVIGPAAFQKGLQTYLAAHRYGNAQWSDLIGAFERASGQSLHTWADAYIQHRGMPRVDAAWTCDGSKLTGVTLSQRPMLSGVNDRVLWPIATQIAFGFADGTRKTVRAELNSASASVKLPPDASTCPAYVFANDRDFGYGSFPLDAKSRDYVAAHIGQIDDTFQRTLLWGSLWDGVRNAEYAPKAFVHLALDNLASERDESLTASVAGRAQTALRRYIGESATDAHSGPTDFNVLSGNFAKLAADRMEHDSSQDLRIVWFRSLGGLANTVSGSTAVKALLGGTLTVPGVQLRQQDRWGLVTALLAYSDADAEKFLAAEKLRDTSGDGKKFAWIAEAARPAAATKQQYFTEYLHNPDRPEDWIEGSLGAFNYWNQSPLTQPFLKPALDALPQIKQQRKIFFLTGWLNAFIGGQQSAASRDIVHQYLVTAPLDRDLRLKILEAVDELDRTVKIRETFAVQ